ncbi:MAG: peptide chain release factor N(5)-glutamine methyltransferase [Cyanobacteria bacterium SZAS-4]|nr:peptide chain release factor N(5)-glutamine methyltransferase [Cyanobacteria bacterium SZAS-4]
MTTFSDAKKQILFRLNALGIADHEARRECELMILHATGCDTAQQILKSDDILDQAQETILFDLLKKRENRVPLQYCIGHTWFMGLRFEVEPGILIPRADTETLVSKSDQIISSSDNPDVLKVVDVGIGSGAIAVSLLKMHPALHVVGIDISPLACSVAMKNAASNGVASRLRIECGDWRSLLPGDIDILISNPPYIPRSQAIGLLPEVGVYEPEEALFGLGEDGLGFYRDFASQVPSHFRKGRGTIALEVGDGQSDSVSQIFASQGWLDLQVGLDMSGSPRVLTARK